MKKMVMVLGGSSVGKTSFIRHVIRRLSYSGGKSVVAKMDCIKTDDGRLYEKDGVDFICAISGDICPDHFLVSNLPELWKWAKRRKADYLFIESAGLCHRCSPATKKTLSLCMLDATAGGKAPSAMGPMLLKADAIIITKTDMVSQAEKEIIGYQISQLNTGARIFFIDAREGFGCELVADYIKESMLCDDYEEDQLRHPMPSAVCSYCVGECRVGSAYQLGNVGKMEFDDENDNCFSRT